MSHRKNIIDFVENTFVRKKSVFERPVSPQSVSKNTPLFSRVEISSRPRSNGDGPTFRLADWSQRSAATPVRNPRVAEGFCRFFRFLIITFFPFPCALPPAASFRRQFFPFLALRTRVYCVPVTVFFFFFCRTRRPLLLALSPLRRPFFIIPFGAGDGERRKFA